MSMNDSFYEEGEEEEQQINNEDYEEAVASNPPPYNPLNSSSSSTRSIRAHTATEEPRPVDRPNDRIHVYVRVRPLISREANAEKVVYSKSENEVAVESAEHRAALQVDRVFHPSMNQEDVYNNLRDCVQHAADGYNSTVFAYGQTSSGKTYTLFGSEGENDVAGSVKSVSESAGIIPRAIRELFGYLERKQRDENSQENRGVQYTVYCSFLQLYNERLMDLLTDAKPITSPKDLASTPKLTIHESGHDGVYVEGLSEYLVTNAKDCLAIVAQGSKNRAIRATHMNEFSSRSHSILQLQIERQESGASSLIRSKLNLVDLAGSERWTSDRSVNMDDAHISEMTNINLSLHTLSRCIESLAKKNKTRSGKRIPQHLPYRESKLTYLLKDSLGGNARTRIIVTVSPAESNVQETLNSLMFADSAKKVMTHAKLNTAVLPDRVLVKQLQAEVARLRKELLRYQEQGVGAPQDTIQNETELEANQATSDYNFARANLEEGSVAKHMLKLERQYAKLLNENKNLKEEVKNARHKQTREPDSAPPPADSSSDIDTRSVSFLLSRLERSLSKFFNLDIEEEDLQTQTDSLLQQLRKSVGVGLGHVEPTDTLSPTGSMYPELTQDNVLEFGYIGGSGHRHHDQLQKCTAFSCSVAIQPAEAPTMPLMAPMLHGVGDLVRTGEVVFSVQPEGKITESDVHASVPKPLSTSKERVDIAYDSFAHSASQHPTSASNQQKQLHAVCSNVSCSAFASDMGHESQRSSSPDADPASNDGIKVTGNSCTGTNSKQDDSTAQVKSESTYESGSPLSLGETDPDGGRLSGSAGVRSTNASLAESANEMPEKVPQRKNVSQARKTTVPFGDHGAQDGSTIPIRMRVKDGSTTLKSPSRNKQNFKAAASSGSPRKTPAEEYEEQKRLQEWLEEKERRKKEEEEAAARAQEEMRNEQERREKARRRRHRRQKALLRKYKEKLEQERTQQHDTQSVQNSVSEPSESAMKKKKKKKKAHKPAPNVKDSTPNNTSNGYDETPTAADLLYEDAPDQYANVMADFEEALMLGKQLNGHKEESRELLPPVPQRNSDRQDGEYGSSDGKNSKTSCHSSVSKDAHKSILTTNEEGALVTDGRVHIDDFHEARWKAYPMLATNQPSHVPQKTIKSSEKSASQRRVSPIETERNPKSRSETCGKSNQEKPSYDKMQSTLLPFLRSRNGDEAQGASHAEISSGQPDRAQSRNLQIQFNSCSEDFSSDESESYDSEFEG
eukprot:gb/GECG01002457.1/.p1 GENE.gb/GECG01002457.1/~~gb/GECG01002457.1/.p1  ORF type:complete len:1247 (+),score=219.20 gb/GECG01002457.1/:1-3741(+)